VTAPLLRRRGASGASGVEEDARGTGQKCCRARWEHVGSSPSTPKQFGAAHGCDRFLMCKVWSPYTPSLPVGLGSTCRLCCFSERFWDSCIRGRSASSMKAVYFLYPNLREFISKPQPLAGPALGLLALQAPRFGALQEVSVRPHTHSTFRGASPGPIVSTHEAVETLLTGKDSI
jgi:hypothetical protein